MVSETKVRVVKELSGQMGQYPVIGILDMFKLPARQLHQIRAKLKGKAVIRMAKKRLIIKALGDSGLPGLDSLAERIQGEPALVMTSMNPFSLARLIQESKSEAPAKEGDIAPRDIMVKAGPTSLPPGPVIGELQKAKIPASIEGEKIHVREDTVIAREGQEIDGLLSGVMAKLGIMPMEIGLNLVSAWEGGVIYGRDILLVPRETYLNDLTEAYRRAFSLAIHMGIPTRDTVPFLLSKAHSEAFSLARSAGIVTKETTGPLMARAASQAKAIRARAGLPAEDEAIPEAPEEAKETAQEESAAEADKAKAAGEETPPEAESKPEAVGEDKPEAETPEEEAKPEEKPAEGAKEKESKEETESGEEKPREETKQAEKGKAEKPPEEEGNKS